MKKSVKRVLSVIVTLVMALTVLSALSISAAAEEYVALGGNDRIVFDKSGAKTMKKGEKYKGNSGQTALSWYKFEADKSGTFKLDYITSGSNTNIALFDSSGNVIPRSNITVTEGYLEASQDTYYVLAHSENDKFSAKISYKVKKGKYYLAILPGWADIKYGGAFTVKATYPCTETTVSADTTDSTTGNIMYLSTVIEEGDTLKLAAVTSNSAKVTYSSSDKTVVTVDSNGKIKAKKEGTAYITIKSGSTVIKVKVTVVDD